MTAHRTNSENYNEIGSLEVVNKFKYLSLIPGECQDEIKFRLAIMRNSTKKFATIWKEMAVSQSTKL